MGSAGTAEPILSHYQAAPLLAAHARGDRVAETSLDLARTVVPVTLADEGVLLPDETTLPWPAVRSVAASRNACFRVAGGQVEAVRVFSEETQRVYSLMPTPRAPTMLVSGLYMHRIKGTDPVADTDAKVAALAPIRGAVLDPATGLGYTAIGAARTADHVVTIELDPAVLEICRANPWSRGLFEDPRIEQHIGDAAELVARFDPGSFDRIIHDPPTMSLAGDLYSGAFYRELHRVLRPGGRLFHYVGNPASASGSRAGKGVMKRLREAGFSRVAEWRAAFGYVVTR